MSEQIELILDNKLQELVEAQNVAMHDLYTIQFQTPPSHVSLPSATAQNTYNIDLTTRVIDAPKTLSVTRDHKSSVIYFKTDRYVNYVDLANTICVVEYIIPDGDKKVPYLYVVPFYDTQKIAGKIVFPWVINGTVAKNAGFVEYDVRFYRLDNDVVEENSKIVYDLHTLSARSEILAGLDINQDDLEYEYDYDASYKDVLAAQIAANQVFWHTLG